MRLGVRQLMRVTRLFLAVAVLWLATAPAAAPAFEVWSETAAMVAAPTATAREAEARGERVTLPARALTAPSAELVSAPRLESPSPRASRRVARAPELYLRNCALLC